MGMKILILFVCLKQRLCCKGWKDEVSIGCLDRFGNFGNECSMISMTNVYFCLVLEWRLGTNKL